MGYPRREKFFEGSLQGLETENAESAVNYELCEPSGPETNKNVCVFEGPLQSLKLKMQKSS